MLLRVLIGFVRFDVKPTYINYPLCAREGRITFIVG